MAIFCSTAYSTKWLSRGTAGGVAKTVQKLDRKLDKIMSALRDDGAIDYDSKSEVLISHIFRFQLSSEDAVISQNVFTNDF